MEHFFNDYPQKYPLKPTNIAFNIIQAAFKAMLSKTAKYHRPADYPRK